jgi:membrane protease YdiL (CAAX protease family)
MLKIGHLGVFMQPDNLSPGNQPPEAHQPAIIRPEIIFPGPEKPVWGVWPTLGFGAAVFAVYFTAQTLVAAYFAISQLVVNPLSNPLQFIQGLASNGLLISIATIVSTIAGVGFIGLFIKLRKNASIKEYLGLKPVGKKSMLLSLAALIVLMAGLSYVEQMLGKQQSTQFTVDIYKTAVWPGLLWLAVVVFAPVFEEAFFRGFLFVGLQQSRIGSIGTIILTAAAWAALHIQYDLYGMLNVLILGLVLGIIRLKTGSLWSTVLLHSVWNLAAMLATVLYINGIGA